MKRLTYNWMWHIIILAVTITVLSVAAYDWYVLSNPSGLEVLAVTSEEDCTRCTLDGGLMKIDILLNKELDIKVGDRAPIVDALMPAINRGYLMLCILVGVVVIFAVWEVAMLGDRLKRRSARISGRTVTGEVVRYEHFTGPYNVMKVEANGGKFSYKYPLTKKEMEKYPVGTPVVVYIGGVRNNWVDITRKPS